jgi:altronate dehydratase
MEALERESFARMVEVASGARTVGEKAGHSQVQLWREWRKTGANQAVPIGAFEYAPLLQPGQAGTRRVKVLNGEGGPHARNLGLVLPTSLCAGQIGLMVAQAMNRGAQGGPRFVALPHTEGCGCSSGDSEEILLRTLAGHLRHPFVRHALLLEHGCEKTHNDALRSHLKHEGVDLNRFGWGSVQMDGGIELAVKKARHWLSDSLSHASPEERVEVPLTGITIGVIADGAGAALAQTLSAALLRHWLAEGGSAVVPASLAGLADLGSTSPTLSFASAPHTAGLHVMAAPTDDAVELITGLGAAGVQLIVAFVGTHRLAGHPMIPTLRVGEAGDELDMVLNGDVSQPIEALIDLVCRTLSGDYEPKAGSAGITEFQVSRGEFGVSL